MIYLSPFRPGFCVTSILPWPFKPLTVTFLLEVFSSVYLFIYRDFISFPRSFSLIFCPFTFEMFYHKVIMHCFLFILFILLSYLLIFASPGAVLLQQLLLPVTMELARNKHLFSEKNKSSSEGTLVSKLGLLSTSSVTFLNNKVNKIYSTRIKQWRSYSQVRLPLSTDLYFN